MNGINILVIEDEPSVGEVVSLYLRRAGYQVQVLTDGKEALAYLEKQIPGMVILDLMLPGINGLDITNWLRARSEVPIIMLTARTAETDRIAGLEYGADDYVTKPFSPQELVSRVRAVLRRSQPPAQQQPAGDHLDHPGLHMDLNTRLVTWNSREISLTAREFDLLWHLARHPRQVFTREQLLESIWGLSDYIDPGTVTVHIRRLREKIEENPAEPEHILTVWGVGYKYEP